jgi:predicted peptidase
MTLRELGTVANAGLGYGEYLPDGYESKSNWPVLIHFHGIGECVGKTTLSAAVYKNGPFRELKDNFGVPMVMIAPQLGPKGVCVWNPELVDNFVDFVLKRYRIDPKRLYISGLSLGGWGTASYLAAHPERVAAAIAICPGNPYRDADAPKALLNNGVAVWTAVAANDQLVPPRYAFDMITPIWKLLGSSSTSAMVMADYPGVTATAYFDEASKTHRWMNAQDYQAGGRVIDPAYLVTYYPSGGHGVWNRMFSDPKVYEWLLRHSR